MECIKANLLYDARCEIGEGPVYDEKTDVLYWVDITGKSIYAYSLATKECSQLKMTRTVGSIFLREKGGMLAALDDGVYSVQDFQIKPFSKPADLLTGQRFNDGKCDKAGRMYVGVMYTGQSGTKGSFYLIGKDGEYEVLLDGISCSNGLAWSLDNKKLYYVDTNLDEPTYVKEFDYDAESGNISNPRIIIAFPSDNLDTKGSAPTGVADGMTIDSEGMLWVAEWEGNKVSRFNPAKGEKIGEVSLPVSKVTSCTFGGKDLDTLFITTASIGTLDEENAGGVFYASPGVNGFPANRFRY